MNVRMDEDSFAKIAQGISKVYHEVLFLLNFLETKPLVKNMNTKYFDLYYTGIKNRAEKGNVNVQYEKVYNNFPVIIPNH